MIAITVLLAATAASFFFGFGNSELTDRRPTVAIEHTYQREGGSHVLTLVHDGGDTVDAASIRVVVAGAACAGGGSPNGRHTPAALGNGHSELTAGSTVTLASSTLCPPSGGDLDLSESRVSVVWTDANSQGSTVLWRWRGPAA